jgi:hypothetical protein
VLPRRWVIACRRHPRNHSTPQCPGKIEAGAILKLPLRDGPEVGQPTTGNDEGGAAQGAEFSRAITVAADVLKGLRVGEFALELV